MRGIKYKEPKSLLEIRAIKRKLSREIEKYGWEAFHKKSAEMTRDLSERIERARQAKLAGKR